MNTFKAPGPSPVAPVVSDTASCFTCQVLPFPICPVAHVLKFSCRRRFLRAIDARIMTRNGTGKLQPAPHPPASLPRITHDGVQLRPHLWRFCMKVVPHLFVLPCPRLCRGFILKLKSFEYTCMISSFPLMCVQQLQSEAPICRSW